jgi:hypothetical protein
MPAVLTETTAVDGAVPPVGLTLSQVVAEDTVAVQFTVPTPLFVIERF